VKTALFLVFVIFIIVILVLFLRKYCNPMFGYEALYTVNEALLGLMAIAYG
jgi:hypothetical protein